MKRKAGLLAVGIALATPAALAHNGATGVVLERMNGMTAMRDIMRDLAPIIQGAAPYDALAVSEAGYVIAAHSGEAMRALFPENSLEGVTYAKPNIWSEWQDFVALADDLRTYGEDLSRAAPIGADLSPVAEPASPELAPEPASQAAGQAPEPDPQLVRSRKIADLLGYAPPASMGMDMARPKLAQATPADAGPEAVFARISGTCSACHAQFRKGRN